MSVLALVLMTLAFCSLITPGFAAPTKQDLIFHASSHALHVWFDSGRPQVTNTYPPSYLFNGYAETTSGLWITNLHWDWGDGQFTDDPFSGNNRVSELVPHRYLDHENHIVTLTATDNAGNTGSTCVTLRPDFTLSVTPSSQTVNQGDMTTYTVNVDSVCGSSVNVVLTVSSPAPGVTWNFSPNPGNTSFISTLTVQTARDLSIGNYTLNIVGSDAGRTHASTVALNVIQESSTERIRLRLDQQQYNVGDVVLATAFYNGPLPVAAPFGVVFGFYVFDNNGNQVYFSWAVRSELTALSKVRLNWQFQYTIPTNANPGLYKARLVAGFGSVQPPSTYPADAALQASAEFFVHAPSIPGFPFESILAGIALGFLALACISRRRKRSHSIVKKLN